MDYLEFKILSFRHPDMMINAAQTVRRSPRIQQLQQQQSITADNTTATTSPINSTTSPSLRPSSSSPSSDHVPHDSNDLPPSLHDHDTPSQSTRTLSDSPSLLFPKNVMYTIAAWYVELHQVNSPREVAIRTMNTLLNNNVCNLASPSQPIHIPGSSQLQHHLRKQQSSKPTINQLSRPNQNCLLPIQEYIHLHLATMHSSKSTLEPLLKGNLLTDLPPALAKDLFHFDCTCFICALRKSDKVPKGKLVDKTLLAPFQRIHIDFSFFSVTSIRGFTSSLDIRCGSTSFPFAFPSKGKNPPLDVLRYTINTLRTQGFQVNFVRVDEDRGLARSAEFCELILELNCILETTAGGNSTNNGMVERGNRVNANMIRSALTTLKSLIPPDELPTSMKIEELWCFALRHSVFVQRRMYNRLRKDTPFFLVFKKRTSTTLRIQQSTDSHCVPRICSHLTIFGQGRHPPTHVSKRAIH
jgi:hypothetical protein